MPLCPVAGGGVPPPGALAKMKFRPLCLLLALRPSQSLGRSAFCWRSGRVRPPRGYGREGKGQPNLAWPGPGVFLNSSRALGGGRALPSRDSTHGARLCPTARTQRTPAERPASPLAVILYTKGVHAGAGRWVPWRVYFGLGLL